MVWEIQWCRTTLMKLGAVFARKRIRDIDSGLVQADC